MSVHMPPSTDVVCDKCGADLGPAFVGQSVWCKTCKKWVLAERDDDDGD